MSDQPPSNNSPGAYEPPQGYNYQSNNQPNSQPPIKRTNFLGLQENVAAASCYIPSCFCCAGIIISLFWFFTEPKENRFVRFHAVQSCLLGAAWFLAWLAVSFVNELFLPAASTLTDQKTFFQLGFTAIRLFGLLVAVFFFVLSLVAGYKAYKQVAFKIPFIGDIAARSS